MDAGAVGLLSLLFVVVGLILVAAVQAVLIRAAVWVLRGTLFKREKRGQQIGTVPGEPQSWNAGLPQQVGNYQNPGQFGPDGIPTATVPEASTAGPNPYAVSYSQAGAIAEPGTVDKLPMPSFGRAMGIGLLAGLICYVFAALIKIAATRALEQSPELGIFLNLLPLPMSVIVYTCSLKYLLPTTFLRAFLVLFAMILVYMAVGMLIVLIVFIPLTIFG